MTRLKERIIGLIGAVGPIPVSEYMALCLFDPEDGYYTTREPFGAAGIGQHVFVIVPAHSLQ
ncbi:MAG: hypothetical protein E5V67_23345, partial [Mesorhizobium sp.]